MVRLAKRIIKGRTYYYLEHTFREKGRRVTRSKYLGTRLPKNLYSATREFNFLLNKEKWFEDFEQIKRNYNARWRLIPKSAQEKELNEFSIRFTYDTQRIEGSTLTLRETAQLLAHKISPGGRPIEDTKEAEAHQRVFLEMLESNTDLSQRIVEDWHWEIFKETKPDIAGKIRTHGVRISGSNFIPPSPVELYPKLREFFRWYDKTKEKLNSVELAGLVHLRFVTIHPFSDGNGRISRLMMNFVLHNQAFPMMNIEYKRRSSYYRALERSQLSENERIFMNWFFRRYKDENREFLS